MVLRSRLKRGSGGNAAEFPLALLVLFALFAFPSLNLVSIALAYGMTWFIAFQSAATASTQTEFGSSLSSVQSRASEFNSTGLTAMLKMKAIDGYQGCGTDLFVDSVDFMDASRTQTFGPNQAVPPPIDLTNRFYELSANSTYRVEPFVDLGSVPFLRGVPGLASPVTLTARVKRCAEFPQGLVRGPRTNLSPPVGSVNPSPTTSFASPIAAPVSAPVEPWNRPHLYDEIQASGQAIVDHAVVQVNAKNPQWTDTGLVVNPGQMVWIDFRADGEWSSLGQSGFTADGEEILDGTTLVQNFNLMGAVGPQMSSITNAAANNSVRADSTFVVGSSKYKFRPSKTGGLMLGLNDFTAISAADQQPGGKPYSIALGDNYGFNKGSMIVRIVVTQ